MTGLDDLLNSTNQSGTGPRAGLNYLLFDDQMNLLSGSGRLAMGPIAPGVFDNLSTTTAIAPESGFVVVYVDNQTMGKDVWFDNVQVLHYNTQVLEENHYYPFGLTTSVSAMGITVQPYKYQGIELEKNFGLETYETSYRGLDPQLGRFNQIDPLADNFTYQSPYVSMDNNPVLNVDPDGTYSRVGAWLRNVFDGGNGISYRPMVDEWGYEKVNDGAVIHKTGLTEGQINERIESYKNSHTELFGKWVEQKTSGEVRPYEPSIFDRWAESNNFFANFSYSLVNSFYVTGQNLFVKNFRSHDMSFNLDGSPTNFDENMGAFIDVGATFLGSAGVRSAVKNAFTLNGGYGFKIGRTEFLYANPSVGGGTIFSYVSKTGRKFRLDYHGLPSLNRGNTLHFHTNYGGYTNSPHRSLNPFHFGQPIK